MKMLSITILVATVLLTGLFGGCAGDPESGSIDAILPAEYGFEFFQPEKDPATGFMVGGLNSNDTILNAGSFNGIPIDELQKIMRPGHDGPEGSTKGFLGPEESLKKILIHDNTIVVDKYGLRHRDLARPLLIIGYYARKHSGIQDVCYKGLRLQIEGIHFKGFQLSPFRDGTKTNTDVRVKNLDSGETLEYSLLVPHMIERYGFYEGTGTTYRVDPEKIIRVFQLSNSPSE